MNILSISVRKSVRNSTKNTLDATHFRSKHVMNMNIKAIQSKLISQTMNVILINYYVVTKLKRLNLFDEHDIDY